MTPHPSLDSLLRARAEYVERIAKIDAVLAERGVRPIRGRGRPRSVSVTILEALEDGPKGAAEIAARTGQKRTAAGQMLLLMARAGEIVRVAHGRYGLVRP